MTRRPKREREYLTEPEINALLAASTRSRNPERDYCLILLAYLHGLRVSELISLRLDDIDLIGKRFFVPRLKGCDSGEHPFFDGESEALKKWLVERAKMNPPEDCDWLFISERRKALSRITVWLLVKELGEKTGLEVTTHPHMLRHSCGYTLINEDGANLRVIQAFLGHRSISSTVRYTRLDSKRFMKLHAKRKAR
jgi:type 1 fimbriae regulatory protein FimB